jgi:hypothetical protein
MNKFSKLPPNLGSEIKGFLSKNNTERLNSTSKKSKQIEKRNYTSTRIFPKYFKNVIEKNKENTINAIKFSRTKFSNNDPKNFPNLYAVEDKIFKFLIKDQLKMVSYIDLIRCENIYNPIELFLACPNLEEIDLQSCLNFTDIGLINLLVNCKKLERINLCNCIKIKLIGLENINTNKNLKEIILSTYSIYPHEKTLTEHGLLKLLQFFPNLEKIDLTSRTNIKFLSESFNLNKLELKLKLKIINLSNTDINTENLIILLNNCPKLESIDLSICKQINFDSIFETLHINNTLRNINLNQTLITDLGLLNLLMKFPKLEDISLKDCDLIQLEDQQLDNRSFNKIKIINLNNTKISNAGLSKLLKLFPSLENISLEYNEFTLENLNLENLYLLNLKIINFSDCWNITDKGLQEFAKLVPNLEEIYITEGFRQNSEINNRITNIGILVLTNLCRELKSVTYYNYHNINPNGTLNNVERKKIDISGIAIMLINLKNLQKLHLAGKNNNFTFIDVLILKYLLQKYTTIKNNNSNKNYINTLKRNSIETMSFRKTFNELYKPVLNTAYTLFNMFLQIFSNNIQITTLLDLRLSDIELNGEFLIMIAKLFPNLENISLLDNSYYTITENECKELSKKLLKLNSIDLSGSTNSNGDDYLILFKSFPNLKYIGLDHTTIDDRKLFEISEFCREIETISLCKSDNSLTYSGISKFINNSPKLKKIIIDDIMKIDMKLHHNKVVLRSRR